MPFPPYSVASALREVEQTRLGGAVAGIAERDQAVDRADVDDRARAARDHAGQHEAGREVRAVQRAGDLREPVLGRGLLEVALERARGVVDQHVDAPERLFHPRQRAFERRLVGDVGAERQRLPAGLADRARRLLGRGAVAIEDREARPFTGQPQRRRAADAPPGAGDQHHLVGVTHLSLLLSCSK